MWYSSYFAIGISPKWNITFTEFRNHCNMNLDQFNDPLCYLCLYGTVVASLSLTQEKAVLNTAILLVQQHILSLSSANSVKTFRENSNISDEKCDRIISDWDWDCNWVSMNWNILYQLVLRSTSSFADKLVQNFPAHQSSSLSANKLVLSKMSWYKMFQLVQIFDKMEHFIPACQKFQFISKRTGYSAKRTGTKCSSSSKLNLNINLSEWRYTMKKGNTIKMRKASSLWRSKMILNYTS